jgi:predicted permease
VAASGSNDRPPRLARALLRLALPAADRAAALSDIDEEFEDRCSRDGRRRAVRWYRAQVRRSLWPSIVRRSPLPGVPVTAATSRSTQRRGPLRGWSADLRLAVRGLLAHPTFAIVMVGTLALGVGGVTAVFTLADPMLFRPLPYPDAEQLFELRIAGTGDFARGSHADLRAFRTASAIRAAGVFDDAPPARLAEVPALGVLRGYSVDEGYLTALGIRPAAGRLFTADEYAAAPSDVVPVLTEGDGLPPPVLVTDQVARALFAEPDVAAGRLMALRRHGVTVPHRIVGVLQSDFVFPNLGSSAPDYLAPLSQEQTGLGHPRGGTTLMVRLAPDASPDAARAEFQALVAQVEREYPEMAEGRVVSLTSIRDVLFARVRPAVWLLLGTVVAVFVLAVSNLAHLSLARGAQRYRELAMRQAIGASRWQLARLLLTETLVVATLGAVGAIALGEALYRSVMAFVPEFGHVYRLMPSGLDLRVAATGVLATAGAVVVMGLLPAATTVRAPSLVSALRDGRGSPRGRRAADRALSAVQTASAMAILVITILLVGSFERLAGTVKGLDLNGLETVSIELPRNPLLRTPLDRRRHWEFASEFRRRAQVELGVTLGLAQGVPGISLPVSTRRAEDAPDSENFVIGFPSDATFMQAIRLELVRGRLFTDEEAHGNARVAVLDERAARFFWPGADPIGQFLADFQAEPPVTRRVVGIVETIDTDFGGDPRTGRAFLPFDPEGFGPRYYVLRGELTPADRDGLARIAGELMPGAIIDTNELRAFERRLGEPKLLARLMLALALLAILLTMAGIYATVSHAVSGRMTEIGVRVALGAAPSTVRRTVLGEAMLPVAVGVMSGTLLALWSSSLFESLLFGLEATSAGVLASAASLVLAIALGASLLPALRAGRVDPAGVLREDG